MKKLALLLALTLLPVIAFGQEWVNSNQSTVAWDAVTYEVDPGERIVYRTYLVNSKTDPDKTNPALIGDTTEPQYLFTFTQKGSYFVGVKSVVQIDNGGTWEDVTESAIGWSDDPTYAQAGETFGIRFYPAPAAPVGLRPVTGSN